MARDYWRLPKGVDEVLPPNARYLELLRRNVLDLFDVWGYDYIEPPIVEYLDALLVGNDLNLQTLQVADQISGRTLGVRADITSQAARIDANSLAADNANGDSANDTATRRLCYAGPVVRANPGGVLESRVPLKAGAEIYGCADISADIEVICLAIDALSMAGLDTVVIELGHVGFVRGMVDELALSSMQRDRLFEAVRIKSEADILNLLGDTPNEDNVAQRLCQLVRLMGDGASLEAARTLFTGDASAESGSASSRREKLLELVDQLDYCAARLRELRPAAEVRFDLSAPVGFGYHQALVFALYDPSHSRALVRGGRYDDIGEQFGNARPATGFDLNLKTLLGLPAVIKRLQGKAFSGGHDVWVSFTAAQPESEQAGLDVALAQLRAQGIRVVQALQADDLRPANCDRELIFRNNQWQPE